MSLERTGLKHFKLVDRLKLIYVLKSSAQFSCIRNDKLSNNRTGVLLILLYVHNSNLKYFSVIATNVYSV